MPGTARANHSVRQEARTVESPRCRDASSQGRRNPAFAERRSGAAPKAGAPGSGYRPVTRLLTAPAAPANRNVRPSLPDVTPFTARPTLLYGRFFSRRAKRAFQHGLP